MFRDESGLKKYLDKMRPIVEKATANMNAKGSRVSVEKTAEGNLLKIEKGGFGHKPANLLVSGNTFKLWQDDPDKLVFEGETAKDLRFNYAIPSFFKPYGLGLLAMNVNKSGGRIENFTSEKWFSVSEELNENDCKIVGEFRKQFGLVGKLGKTFPIPFIDCLDDRDFALTMAARDGHLDEVKQLIELGFELNATNGETPLQAACGGYSPGEGQKEVIEYLLEMGADPNQQYSEDNSTNIGNTPLILLIDQWDEDEKDDGVDVFRMLLDHGAEVNRRGENGDTALLVAVHRGCWHLEVVRLFMQYNPDLSLTGEDGKTVLEIAEEDEEEEIAAVLAGR